MCALMLLAVASLVSAAADKKKAFLQQKGSRDHETETRAVNSNSKHNHREVDEDGETYGFMSSRSYMARVVMQLLVGLLYYSVIVSRYPSFSGEPTPAAKKLQATNEISAICEVSFPICILSWCCSGPRAAHTFYSAGISDYWCSLLGMSFCPCCVLCVADSCTDLNERLGGQSRGWFVSCLCSFCCSCCMIAQDAESLDLTTGVKTGFCGVYERRNL